MLVGGSALLVVVLTTIASRLHHVYEGEALSAHEAFLFVIETMTTTGYGELLPFESWQMTLFAVFVMLIGFSIIFIGVVTIAGEWLKHHFQELPPTQAPPRLKGHVVLTSYNPLVESLVAELRRFQIPFVVVHPDREVVSGLIRDGIFAIQADPSTNRGLEAAGIKHARALLAVGSDEDNATVVLESRAYRSVPVFAVVDRMDNASALKYAGADRVLSPKQVLGEELARWALSSGSHRLHRQTSRFEDLELREIPVVKGSPLSGKSLRDVDLRARSGASVLGYWDSGVFRVVEDASRPFPEHCVVTIAGTESQVARAARFLFQADRPLRLGEGKVIVAGYGDVGRTVVAAVTAEGRECSVIDLRRIAFENGHVGDATEESDLLACGVPEAGTYIVALESDAKAIYSTLIARKLGPKVRILARCKSVESIDKLYRAGADAVLSLSAFGGQILASLLIHGKRTDLQDQDVAFCEWRVGETLHGSTIAESRLYSRYGVLIIGVEAADGGSIVTNPHPSTRLERGQGLVLLGSRDAIDKFQSDFPESG